MGKINTFGMYAVFMLFFEMALFAYATFRSYVYLKEVQKEQKLQIPTWILYSNPISTGILTLLSFLMMIVMIGGYSAMIDKDIVLDA
jgi:amino acid transporter